MKKIIICILVFAAGLYGSKLHAFQVYVATSTGMLNRPLEVEPTDLIDNVKQKIQDLSGFPPAQQILYFKGIRLDDNLNLSNYNIQSGDTIGLNNHTIISVVSGSGFNIKAGTIIGAEGLDLTPSSDFSLGNSLTLSGALNNSTSFFPIRKSYLFSNTTAAYSGLVKINYQESELNGLIENGLKLLIYNGSSWSLDNNSSSDTTDNVVFNNSVSGVTLKEISAGVCSNTGDTTVFACNSFDWYGTTYNSSATPTHTFTNVNGCDSVVTLHLTVGHANTGDTTATACGSFVWYGVTYTSSSRTSPTHTFTNVSGCDSVVTLHLTINNIDSIVSTTTGSRCGTGSVTLSAATSNGASIKWYTLSSGGSLLYTGNTYATPSITSTKTYYAEAFNGLCASSRVAVVATINTTKPATPGSISGLTRQCQYATNQVYSIVPVANALKYRWTLPVGWSFVGDATSNSVTVNVGGNVNLWDISQALSVAAVNDCGTSASKTLAVTLPMLDPTPRSTAGLTNVCSKIGLAQPNDTVRYKVTSGAGAAYTNYAWALSDPSTMRIVDVSGPDSLWIAVRFALGSFVSGNVYVGTKTNCGYSSPKIISIGTSAAGTVTSVKGATNVCSKVSANPSDTFRYTALLSGAIGYKWTISGTSSNLVSIVDAATDSSWIAVHYSTGFTIANLNVKAISACGITSTTAKSIAAGILAPSAPTSLTGTTNICPIVGTQKGYTYTSSSVTGALSYVWTVPNGAVIDSPAVTPYGTKVKVRFVTAGSKDSIYVQAKNNCTTGAKKVLKLVTTTCVTPVFAKTSAHSESTNESIRMSVFPNPTTSDFNIQLKGLTSKDLASIRVMDLQGRVIKVMNIMSEQNLSIGSDLKAGTYLIEVRQGKNLVTQKVIKY
jgi:hypothetical protein